MSLYGGDESAVMTELSKTSSVERTHSRWLGTSIVCCFPRLSDQSEPEPKQGKYRVAAEGSKC